MYSCFGPLNSSSRDDFYAKKSINNDSKIHLLQDIDLNFIRQFARGLKEYDLEQKIDLEIRMREGTTKLLAACRHPSQALEASKNLLTSNERMSAYMAELQKRKTENIKKFNAAAVISHSSSKVEPSRAKICVSDIRMPLIWKDTDHFKNKGDHRRYAVFCLLKIGTEIYDTVMLNEIDRSMTDISFDDVIIFNHIPPGFEFKLEVYCHVLHEDFSIASTPRKLKNKIANSVGRTMGRKLAASLKEELNSNVGPKFECIARASLFSCDIHDSIRTHDLALENTENPSHQLPLFGHFCCRLAAQPECMLEDKITGYLSYSLVDKKNKSSKLWAQVKNFQLGLWTTPDESDNILTIKIDKDSKIKSCKEPDHSFIISNPEHSQNFIFTADNDSESCRWMAALRQHQQDFSSWEKASESLMSLPSPDLSTVPFFMRSRGGTLYDETPLKESPRLRSKTSIGTSPDFRSRSSSSSSLGSSSGSSRIVNPFSTFY